MSDRQLASRCFLFDVPNSSGCRWLAFLPTITAICRRQVSSSLLNLCRAATRWHTSDSAHPALFKMMCTDKRCYKESMNTNLSGMAVKMTEGRMESTWWTKCGQGLLGYFWEALAQVQKQPSKEITWDTVSLPGPSSSAGDQAGFLGIISMFGFIAASVYCHSTPVKALLLVRVTFSSDTFGY